MAISDLTLVPLRWRGVMLDGSPARGRIVLRPRAARFLIEDLSVFAALLTAEIDDDGYATLNVPATDDPALSVDGFTYEVTEDLTGDLGDVFEIEVPLSAAANGIDLNTVIPVEPSPGVPVTIVTRTEFEVVKAKADDAATTADLAEKADQTVLEAFASGVTTAIGSLSDAAVATNGRVDDVISDLAALDAAIDDRVEDAVEAHTPGIELGHADRVTSVTSTATTVTAAVDIPAFSVTVIGKGRPVDVEFYCPSVSHTVANANVTVCIAVNGVALDARAGFGSASSPSTAVGAGPTLIAKRSGVVLANGVSYTFTVRPYTFSVAGTATLYAVSPYMPMTLSVVAR